MGDTPGFEELRQCGVVDDPTAKCLRRLAGRLSERRVAGGVGDLVEQVEQLAHRPNEVAGSQVGLGQDRLESISPGPPPGRVCETQIGLAQEIQVVLLLQVVEMAPEPNHRAENIRYTAGWQRRRDCIIRLPRLVAERRQARGELGRLEVVPQSFPQCFGGEQVELGVEPGQPAAGRRDLVAP